MKAFLRRTSSRFVKLGRKKKQKWNKPKGRDNKMREKRTGYPKVVSIGYKKQQDNTREAPIIVKNLKDLETAGKNPIIIGHIGKKNKIEIANKAKKMKIEIINLNVNKFLKKMEKKK
jgi:large subunit ribosomal protein L32e